jgi:hypothetical protein
MRDRDGTVHRKGSPMPQLDLQFRPASYWDHPDPLRAILSGIKGQNRREMAQDFVTGQAPAALGPIDPGLLEDRLDEATRDALGRAHPNWMGGEFLPDALPGEVEIARIVLASMTQDVISFRARRRRGGGRIRYRVVDEYGEPGEPGWTCRPASSARPLTLGQVITLIDRAVNPGFALGEGALTDLLREAQEGTEPEDAARFVRVVSDFYPGLEEHFDRRAGEWLERKRRELGPEEDGDDA